MPDRKPLEGMNAHYQTAAKRVINVMKAKDYIGKVESMAELLKKEVPEITPQIIKNLMNDYKLWDRRYFNALQRVVFMYDRADWLWMMEEVLPGISKLFED